MAHGQNASRCDSIKNFLTTVEWDGFKLTFLEKDICHDHEIDILRTLAKLQLRYVLKKCAIPTDLDLGVLSIKSLFLYFSGPNIKHS